MSSTPAPQDESFITVSIHILVIDEIGEPVSEAAVTVSRDLTLIAAKPANSSGEAYFEELMLECGLHTLEAAKDGYVSEKQDLAVSPELTGANHWVVFRLERIEEPRQYRQQSAFFPKPSVGSGRVLHEPSGLHAYESRPAGSREEHADVGNDAEFVDDLDQHFDEGERAQEASPAILPAPNPAPAPAAAASPAMSEEKEYFRVRVYFATDRNQSKGSFGNDRAPDAALSLGLCAVAIPKTHHLGEMERPSVFKLEFMEAPEKHVVVLSVTTMREAYFLESLDMMAAKAPSQDALVFIHGYNVTFAEAVRRTAQVAFDLNFTGIPVCYSWPSAGKHAGYMADETSIEWTIPHLLDFLRKLVEVRSVRTVHLIAHSMGNRALVNCLSKLAETSAKNGQPFFHETILAAPDIDAGVFRQLAENFVKVTRHTTLYASSKDLALQISQQFHRYPRAGESGAEIVVLPTIDSVDASEVPTGFLGHSYYGGARSVLSDVYELIRSGTPPPRFGLRQTTGKNGVYWVFVP